MKGELSRAAEKRKEFEGRMREVEAESGRPLIRLNNFLV